MIRELGLYPGLRAAARGQELVFLFGAGMSTALSGRPYGWDNWLLDGASGLKDRDLAASLEERLKKKDLPADVMVRIAGEVLRAAREDGSYTPWMERAFVGRHVTDQALAGTLKKLATAQDVLATTNYDLLLEEAAGLPALTYEEPGQAFEMLDSRRSTHVLHIHGLYDPKRGIDNIVADDAQYDKLLDCQGAQFVQRILGTRTLVFVGCGKTTEDPNLSRLLPFVKEQLALDREYYFLYDSGHEPQGLPDGIVPVCYGDTYGDLPGFLEKLAVARLQARMAGSPLVGRLPDEEAGEPEGLSGYHFASRGLPFCGRKTEMAKLRNFLDCEGAVRWWAVTGQAGAGKSRLALEFARESAPGCFAFFLAQDAPEECAAKFRPFHDTLVIVDYVQGNEAAVARTMSALAQAFRPTAYKLRILLLERDSAALSGSWYQRLEEHFPPARREEFQRWEYNRSLATGKHGFLCLDDLEDGAVEELIEAVCRKRGLPPDRHRAKKLKEAYAEKLEQLRFRPLFIQIYVEAWIENGCEQVDYTGYEDLLERVLKREQNRWLEALGGRKDCCAALIRLLVRACAGGELDPADLPERYAGDWALLRRFHMENTLPGIQRRESLDTFVADAAQSIRTDGHRLVPMYPDIIKEAMFLYYTDEDELEPFCAELWADSPEEFSAFLGRCLVDFPDNGMIRACVRRESADYRNLFAMEARLSLLGSTVVHRGDRPQDLIGRIREEETYWTDMPCGSEAPFALRELKLRGLSLCAERFVGWTQAEPALRCIRAVAGLCPECSDLLPGKVSFLLEMAGYFGEKGAWELSEKALVLLRPIQKSMPDKKRAKLVWLALEREHARNLMIQRKWEEGDRLYWKVRGRIKWSDEREVEQFAAFCFTCTRTAWDMLNPQKAGEYADTLQDMAVDYASGRMKIAFNDKIHYYYLHSKFIHMSIVAMSATFLSAETGTLKGYNLHVVDGLIEELEKNEMTADFSGLLVGAWAMKTGMDEKLTDRDVLDWLRKAEGLLERYPDNELLGEQYIELLDTAYSFQFERRAPEETVEKAYAVLLRFPGNEKIIYRFFKLLENSVESGNRERYLRNKAVLTGIIETGQTDLLYRQAAAPAPVRRTGRKIGRNEPCPCGSGKKFKKCCMGKGVYD